MLLLELLKNCRMQCFRIRTKCHIALSQLFPIQILGELSMIVLHTSKNLHKNLPKVMKARYLSTCKCFSKIFFDRKVLCDLPWSMAFPLSQSMSSASQFFGANCHYHELWNHGRLSRAQLVGAAEYLTEKGVDSIYIYIYFFLFFGHVFLY